MRNSEWGVRSARQVRPVCGCAPSAFGVAAFGRKPPSEFPYSLRRSAETPLRQNLPLQFRQPARDFFRIGAAVEGADAETALTFEPEFLSRLPRQRLLPLQQRGMRIVKSAVEGMRREIV